MKERVKPHIQRLPITQFPDYAPRDAAKVAVSIPLFHSAVDSGNLSGFDETRFREVHIKGAVWAAMGIIENTDLGEQGVPIYFHIEHTLSDIVVDEMAKYEGLPVEDMIRLVKIPQAEDKGIRHPLYGKKLMCINDIEIARDVWLLVDSDAFACTTGQRLQWYTYLSKLQNPAPLIVWGGNYKDKYADWVKAVAMGTGQPFIGDANTPYETLYHQEQAFIRSVGLDYIPTPPSQSDIHVCTSTHIFAMPTQHPIVPFLQQHYHNCYQDEFLLGLWHTQHGDLVSLKDELSIQHYKKETPFVERDKTTDSKGYLAHITPDYGKTEQTQVDTYYDDFYHALASKSEPKQLTKPSLKPKARHQKTQLRLFLLGVAYGRTSKKMLSSPFVQKVLKHAKMMKNLGHHVVHLGHELSEVDCDEHVTVTNDDILQRAYGVVDGDVPPDNVAPDDMAFRYFHANAERELRKRVQPNDIVLSFFGLGDKPLCDRIADLPCHIVEASIGYPTAFAKYRVYQSPSKMHYHRGLEKSVNDPNPNVTVIPNFYDAADFPFNPNKGGDYMLFIGRVHPCKGLDIAIKLAEYTGEKLIVAGPGDINSAGVPIPKNVEYVGVADLEMRSDLYYNARFCILPSRFSEPFHGTHAESGLHGRPIIVPNQGATMDYCQHGITGYRCHYDFDDYLTAYENIDAIEPVDCRNWAMNFTLEPISLMYHDFYHRIIRNADKTDFFEVSEKRGDLHAVAFPYPKERIDGRIGEIQSAIVAETQALASKKKGVCVQIGIHTTPEYAYLADANWQETMTQTAELKRVPDHIAKEISTWDYYGVDADVACIAEMVKAYPTHSRQWINAYMDGEAGRLRDAESIMPNAPLGLFKVPSSTLSSLFQDLGLQHVDVLAMDIEGGEFSVLEAYDWTLKPTYLSVEIHGDSRVPNVANEKLLDSNIEKMTHFLKTKGYTPMRKTYTNLNKTGRCTCELQFLLGGN